MGNGHSPSDIPCTSDYMVSLRQMRNVVSVSCLIPPKFEWKTKFEIRNFLSAKIFVVIFPKLLESIHKIIFLRNNYELKYCGKNLLIKRWVSGKFAFCHKSYRLNNFLVEIPWLNLRFTQELNTLCIPSILLTHRRA